MRAYEFNNSFGILGGVFGWLPGLVAAGTFSFAGSEMICDAPKEGSSNDRNRAFNAYVQVSTLLLFSGLACLNQIRFKFWIFLSQCDPRTQQCTSLD